MLLHGGASIWSVSHLTRGVRAWADPTGVLTTVLDKTATKLPDPPRLGAGFRHFFNAVPTAAQRVKIDGQPFDPTVHWERADQLTRRLLQRMQLERPADFNPGIPSGYTYLLQLVAHDMVHSSAVISRSDGNTLGLGNARGMPLRLETIYGGGPTESPHAYVRSDSGFQKQLRLGRVRSWPAGGAACPRHDIDRARAEAVPPASGCPEALISDPRNDSHTIISQLTSLCHVIHNRLVAIIEQAVPGTGSRFVREQRTFIAAQAAFILIYRHLIRVDLLERILHPAVRAAYESGGSNAVIDPAEGLSDGYWLAPLEFTHGVFRFAHAMIRNKYTFNSHLPGPGPIGFELAEILRHTSEQRPTEMPLELKWTVEWEHFFSFAPEADNNFSVRITPSGRMALGGALGGDPPHDKLVYRDLVSAILVQPWSLAELVARIRLKHKTLLESSELLRDASVLFPWESAVRTWLQAEHVPAMTPADITTLAQEPPLPFFVRFEAQHDAQGKHLGILGSIIVADVFYAIFEQDRILGIESKGDLQAELRALSKQMFGSDDVFRDVGAPARFGDLITTLGL